MSVSSTAVTNTFAYDALGRQTGVTDGRGNTSITAYTGSTTPETRPELVTDIIFYNTERKKSDRHYIFRKGA